MAASLRRSRRWRTETDFLTFLLFIVVSCDLMPSIQSLHHFTPAEILTATKNSCLILLTEFADAEVSDMFHELALRTFESETKTSFGFVSISSFAWPYDDTPVFDPAENNPLVEVVVFEKQVVDRTCLMPVTGVTKKPSIAAYSGVMTPAAVAEFVNTKCNTYRSVNGGLNIIGLHRQEIINNIFKVSSISNVKMKDLIIHEQKSSPNLTPHHEKDTDAQFCRHGDGESCDKLEKEMHLKTQTQTEESATTQHDTKPHIPKCEVISLPNKNEFFHDYLKLSRPVIIKNVTNQWPAFKKWKNDYLKKEYGDNDVHIKLTPGGEYEGVEQSILWENYKTFIIPKAVKEQLLHPELVVVRPATLNLKFSKFIKIIENVSQGKTKNISAYLEYTSIPQHLPELEKDIVEMPFMSELLERDALNIWLSDGHTLGKLHFDPYDNLLCQVSGKKQVILFDPHDNRKLYESHIPEAMLSYDSTSSKFRRKSLVDSTSMVMSPVDIVKPDFQKFPLFADVHPLNCTIDEGDVLFMPAFWWHEVQSYPNIKAGRNLAVNYWYEPFLTKEFPCQECPLDINPKYRHLL